MGEGEKEWEGEWEWEWVNCTAALLGEEWNWEWGPPPTNVTVLEGLLRHTLRAATPVRREQLLACLATATARPFLMPWWGRLAWGLLFGAMLGVATAGNLLVIWTVLGHRRMRTVTNHFLLNLSVSDLMMADLNCAVHAAAMVGGHWALGGALCVMANATANLSVGASAFTLAAISVDRYMAIVHPLRHRMSRGRARLVLAVIWGCSGLLAMPCVLYSTTLTRRYARGDTRVVCYLQWPDGSYPSSLSEYVYNLIFLGVTYIIPMTAMGVCYTLMGRVLWGGSTIGEGNTGQGEALQAKRKVVRMLLVVVVIFGLCWLPYHTYFIYAYHHQQAASHPHVQHVYLAFYWLAMAHAVVNPIIYYCMNTRFRQYFRRVLCRCWCVRTREPHTMELPSRKHNSLYGAHRSSRSRGECTGATRTEAAAHRPLVDQRRSRESLPATPMGHTTTPLNGIVEGLPVQRCRSDQESQARTSP